MSVVWILLVLVGQEWVPLVQTANYQTCVQVAAELDAQEGFDFQDWRCERVPRRQ